MNGSQNAVLLIAVIMVNILYLLCHIPLFIDSNINTSGRCINSSRKNALIWHWANLVMYFLVPFIVIFICNVFIIYGLRRAAINRKKKFNQEDKKISSTTVMLVVVGVVYLLTISPSGIYLIGYSYNVWPNHTVYDVAKLYLVYAITLQLTYINSAINFLLYCCTGSKFRLALRELFGKLCKAKGKPSGGTLSKSGV